MSTEPSPRYVANRIGVITRGSAIREGKRRKENGKEEGVRKG
jgi:hypothetical protein